MAHKKVFYNKDGQELDCFINKENELFINIGEPNDYYYSGYITLEKKDAKEFIDYLQELYNNM